MKYFLGVLALIVGITSSVHAQTIDDLSITASPSNPTPGKAVTFTIESYITDINQASIVWKYNDKVIDGGIGKKSITVNAPSAGSVALVTATASGAGFSSTTTSFTMRPGSIDLVWEAVDVYIPPFYKGKALASINSMLRVVAIPSASAPKQINYTWSRDNTVLGSFSGIGKSSLLFRNSELNTVESIGVTGQSANFNGTVSTTIPFTSPTVVVYQKEDGFINYARGFSNLFSTTEPGVILRIEPFFFSVPTASLLKSLVFTVMQNQVTITNPTTANELYLAAPVSGGTSTVQITVETIAETLQNAIKNFTITFN